MQKRFAIPDELFICEKSRKQPPTVVHFNTH